MAQEYEILIQRFEKAGLKKPANLRRVQGEATMSYVLARYRRGLDYSSDEIEAALDTFLKRKVPQWLDAGHYSLAGRWMKLAFWRNKLDPIATLLRCYDYLPHLERPSYNERRLPVISPRHLRSR